MWRQGPANRLLEGALPPVGAMYARIQAWVCTGAEPTQPRTQLLGSFGAGKSRKPYQTQNHQWLSHPQCLGVSAFSAVTLAHFLVPPKQLKIISFQSRLNNITSFRFPEKREGKNPEERPTCFLPLMVQPVFNHRTLCWPGV